MYTGCPEQEGWKPGLGAFLPCDRAEQGLLLLLLTSTGQEEQRWLHIITLPSSIPLEQKHTSPGSDTLYTEGSVLSILYYKYSLAEGNWDFAEGDSCPKENDPVPSTAL